MTVPVHYYGFTLHKKSAWDGQELSKMNRCDGCISHLMILPQHQEKAEDTGIDQKDP
jgi:hypothetical protein